MYDRALWRDSLRIAAHYHKRRTSRHLSHTGSPNAALRPRRITLIISKIEPSLRSTVPVPEAVNNRTKLKITSKSNRRQRTKFASKIPVASNQISRTRHMLHPPPKKPSRRSVQSTTPLLQAHPHPHAHARRQRQLQPAGRQGVPQRAGNPPAAARSLYGHRTSRAQGAPRLLISVSSNVLANLTNDKPARKMSQKCDRLSRNTTKQQHRGLRPLRSGVVEAV